MTTVIPQHRSSSRPDRRGFTLVEVMISSILLGACLIVIGASFVSGLSFIPNIREISIATMAAQEQLEINRNRSLDQIIALGANYNFTTPQLNQLNSAVGTVTIDNPFGNNNIRRITATVTWNTSSSGTAVTRQLATLVTRRGLNRK